MSNTANGAVRRGKNNRQFVDFYGLKVYWMLEIQTKRGQDQWAVCLSLKHREQGVEYDSNMGSQFKRAYLIPRDSNASQEEIQRFLDRKIPDFLSTCFYGSAKTRTAALKRFNAYKAKLSFPVFAESFKDAVLKHHETWAASTRKDFLDGLDILNDLFKGTLACGVIPELCKDLIKGSLSNYRVNQCLFALEHLYALWSNPNPWAGHANSFRKLTRPNPTGQANLKVLCFSEQEKAQLAAAASANLHSGIDKTVAFAQELMLLRGLSAEEVCALRYGDLTENASYPGEKVLYIHSRVEIKRSRCYIAAPETEAGYRIIPLSPFLIHELDILLDGRVPAEDEFLVYDPRNRKRTLSPDTLLKKTVKDWSSILEWKRTHPTQALTAFSIEQLCQKSLLENLHLQEGAVAYLLGLPPHLTTSISYSAFDSDIYQHMMSAELETLDNRVSPHYSESEAVGQIISDSPQELWPSQNSIASATLMLDARPLSHIRIHAPHNIAEIEVFPLNSEQTC